MADRAPAVATATVVDVLDAGVRQLSAAGVASAGVDARALLAHVLGQDRADPARVLTAAERASVAAVMARRGDREPLQLITGTCGFRLLELCCRPGVFVPRPETEIVAGLAITWVRSQRAGASATASRRERTRVGVDPGSRPPQRCRHSPRSLQTHPVVVEPCTGTGAIGLSVAAEVAGVRVVAGDADPVAVALARHNAERLRHGEAGLPDPAAGSDIEVVDSCLLDGFDPALRGRVDVLVANPPYLPASDLAGLQPEVAAHDPQAALVGGPRGHELVDALLGVAPSWLRPGGTVVVEIDERRGDDASLVAQRAGLVDVTVAADLTGAPRALVAHRGP